MLKLNKQNYHSIEANKDYFSVSQFKSFLDCEAKEIAKINGDWKEEQTLAMLVGSYIHAAVESEEEFQKVIEENSYLIFKAKGGKREDFITADKMIETIKKDKLLQYVLTGEKEVIYTFELFGVWWKIRVDNINHENNFFTDLKTTSDLHKGYWSKWRNDRVSFIEEWGYDIQLAVYEQGLKIVLGKDYVPFIAAVTKEKIPNKEVIRFETFRLDGALSLVEQEINRINNVKLGFVEPRRCGKCDYCKSTKILTAPIEVGDLLGG